MRVDHNSRTANEILAKMVNRYLLWKNITFGIEYKKFTLDLIKNNCLILQNYSLNAISRTISNIRLNMSSYAYNDHQMTVWRSC